MMKVLDLFSGIGGFSLGLERTGGFKTIVENVSILTLRGLLRVLGGFAALGYNAEWHCIPAFAVGAPHRRDRIWIVAYTNGEGWKNIEGSKGQTEQEGRSVIGANAIRCWSHNWEPEPDVGRVANGVPSRVDRLSALGNAVIPQIPEIIGRAILMIEQ